MPRLVTGSSVAGYGFRPSLRSAGMTAMVKVHEWISNYPTNSAC